MLYIWSYFQTIGNPDYSGNYSAVTGNNSDTPGEGVTPNCLPSKKATQKRLLNKGYLIKATQNRLLKKGYIFKKAT